MIKVLCIGDLVGRPGRTAIKEFLHSLVEQVNPTFTIANIENAARGFGVTDKVFREIAQYPIDGFTSGNHIFDKKEFFESLNRIPNLIRPLNYPKSNPGKGLMILKKNGVSLAVINIMGRAFTSILDCPFRTIDESLKELENSGVPIIVDFHAETTSEKQAMGWHLDGRVAAVFGTHTHVQTADERLLLKGTGYITDIGMTGAQDSITGMKKEPIIEKFKTHIHYPFSPPETSKVMLNGIILTIDETTNTCTHIKRVQCITETDT